MNSILVSGLTNIEVTLSIDEFPIGYQPVRYTFHGVNSTVSGVGFNVAAALSTLGNRVDFLSIIGKDAAGSIVRNTLEKLSVPPDFVVEKIEKTPHSVILFDREGKRQINLDLKDIQETPYPEELFDGAVANCQAAVLCNINFSRPFLRKARSLGKLIATDVHALSSFDDDYNHDFIACSDILFLSNELLPCTPEEAVYRIRERFGTKIVVVGCGKKGAVIGFGDYDHIEGIPSVYTRPVLNTIGAGDALFSCFLHYYLKTRDPRLSLKKAMVFASYKIGTCGAAEGFLPQSDLEKLWNTLNTGEITV